MVTTRIKAIAIACAMLVVAFLDPSVARAQGAISSGQTLTGAIFPVGNADAWTFSANTGDAIVIRVGEITQSGAFTPRIRLLDPGAVQIATSSGAVAAEIAVTAASSGTFTVIVDDAVGTSATGTYRLTLAKTGGAVVVSAGDEGGPMTNGVMHTGTIDVGDLDVWTVAANVGESIVVRMGEITLGSTLTPWVRIYSPTGTLLDSNSGAVAGEVAVTAASSGTYLVVAGDASSGLVGGGAYRLTLAKTGSAVVVSAGDEGGPMTNGVMHTGTIDVGDLDAWTFTANVGESIVVRAGEITSGSTLTPWVRLYGPTGTLLASNFGAVAAESVTTAASSGTYLVVVSDGSSGLVGAGAYRLTLAKTGSAVVVSPGDEGGPMTNGVMHTGTIDVGDLDVWTVAANVGEGIVVRMGEITSGSTLTPWVRIYSPTGALLDSSFGAAAGEVAVTAASSGTYLVVATDGSSGLVGVGAYRLTVAKTGSAVVVSAGDEGGPMTNGAMHTGTIDVGDLDAWTFSANVGESIVVRAGEITSGSTLTPWVRLYSPTGALLASNSGAAAAESVATAASSGTYLVVVSDASSGLVGTGAYRLTLAKTGSPVVVSPGDQGGPLPTGTSTGVIDVGDADVWTVYYNAGDQMTLTMQEVTAGSALTPWLRLYSPTGALVSSISGAATATVSAVASASGTYLVVAADASSGLVGSGAYHLTKTAGVATNSDLANIALSAGTLSPSFASGTLSYTANVVSNNNTLTVTPTLADPTATVSVNGTVVANGVASPPITLNAGSNPISVVVLAQDGVGTKTYTVNVTFLLLSSCTYAMSPPDLSNLAAAGGPASIVVTTPAGCPVTATSFQPWVVIGNITPAGPTTSVALQIAPNAGAARATVTVVGDRLYLVTQQPGP